MKNHAAQQAAMIQELINEAKGHGFTVYGPEELTTYFWITDGQRLGYCQHNNPFRAPEFSTVHKPNRTTGTGFKAESFAEALQFAPSWAYNTDKSTVIKYNGPAEFIAKHWQPLKQY